MGWTWKPNRRSLVGEECKGGKFYPDARMGEWSLELEGDVELRIIGWWESPYDRESFYWSPHVSFGYDYLGEEEMRLIEGEPPSRNQQPPQALMDWLEERCGSRERIMEIRHRWRTHLHMHTVRKTTLPSPGRSRQAQVKQLRLSL